MMFRHVGFESTRTPRAQPLARVWYTAGARQASFRQAVGQTEARREHGEGRLGLPRTSGGVTGPLAWYLHSIGMIIGPE